MDEIDRRLMQLLERDGRAPILVLARAIGLSRSATQARMAKLVKAGHIKRFAAILSEGGKPQAIAHALVKLDAGKTCATVVPQIRKLAAAASIHSVAGPHDIIVRLEAANVAELEKARAAIAAANGVADVMTLMVLETHEG